MNSLLVGRTTEHWRLAPDLEADVRTRFLPQIQEYAAMDALTSEDIQIRGMYVCNSNLDYYYSQFDRDALGEVADLLPGRPLMRNHDYKSDAVGRFFAARVVKRPGLKGDWVEALHYSDAQDPEAKRIVRGIDLGILKEGSLGWRCAQAECRICENPIWSEDCGHIPGEVYEEGFCSFRFGGITGVLEASLVYAGGQKGTSSFVPRSADPATARAALSGAAPLAWTDVALYKRTLFERNGEANLRFFFGPIVPGLRNKITSIEVTQEVAANRGLAASWCREHDFRANSPQEGVGSWSFKQRDLPRGTTTRQIKLDEGVVASVPVERKRRDGDLDDVLSQ